MGHGMKLMLPHVIRFIISIILVYVFLFIWLLFYFYYIDDLIRCCGSRIVLVEPVGWLMYVSFAYRVKPVFHVPLPLCVCVCVSTPFGCCWCWAVDFIISIIIIVVVWLLHTKFAKRQSMGRLPFSTFHNTLAIARALPSISILFLDYHKNKELWVADFGSLVYVRGQFRFYYRVI